MNQSSLIKKSMFIMLCGICIGSILFFLFDNNQIVDADKFQELKKIEGKLTDYNYLEEKIFLNGSRRMEQCHLSINNSEYNISFIGLKCFARKAFEEEVKMGDNITVYVHESLGLEAQYEIVEVRKNEKCYLSFKDYCAEQNKNADEELYIKWILTMAPVLLAVLGVLNIWRISQKKH